MDEGRCEVRGAKFEFTGLQVYKLAGKGRFILRYVIFLIVVKKIS